MSDRVNNTECPYIEDVLDYYADETELTKLALGSSYWEPPTEAIEKLITHQNVKSCHRYGNILGLDSLRYAIRDYLNNVGLEMANMEVMITPGANQAFMQSVLTTCDHGDNAILFAPYYFSHKLALQLSGVNISICPFDPSTLHPDWNSFEGMISELKPRVVIFTNPNNPSGAVWTESQIQRVVRLCETHNSWLIVDQTYFQFQYEGSKHVFPCSKKFGYDKIIQIFSFSKSYGMPGWRVGYIIYPNDLNFHLRKVQDTLPTHTNIMAQQLAFFSIEVDLQEQLKVSTIINKEDECNMSNNNNNNSTGYSSSNNNVSWVQQKVNTLETVRQQMWDAVECMGTVKTYGAFYFLVPLPSEVTEQMAIELLVSEYRILLMYGTPFGAPGHLRLSYGNLHPSDALLAVNRLKDGMQHILKIAKERKGNNISKLI